MHAMKSETLQTYSSYSRSAIRALINIVRGLPKGVVVGAHTYGYQFNTFMRFSESGDIVVGKYCSIGPGVKILTGGEHRTDRVSTFPFRTRITMADGVNHDATSKGPTTIGNDVWIGTDALILSGVRIGDGAVVGARSVVASDVPPYSIVAGNPARIIRLRFPEDRIRLLQAIAWWNWSDEEIAANVESFYSDADTFITISKTRHQVNGERRDL